MFDDRENVFNVPYSLPSSAHPIALATRTPTGTVKVDSTKFMPDYGGSLEIPGTRTKQYCLRRGVPFYIKPYYVHIKGSGPSPVPSKTEDVTSSIVVSSYLEPDPNSGPTLSIIRAFGSTLYFNALPKISGQSPETLESNTYSHVPYPYVISGIKYYDTMDKYLIVKFEQGVKIVRLNGTYKIPKPYRSPDSSDTEEEEASPGKISISDKTVMDFVGSFPERRGLHLGDATLTTNQKTLSIASSDKKNIYIRLYDINRAKKFYKTIVMNREDNVQLGTQKAKGQAIERRKSLRSFVPIRQPFEYMQQLECDPSHIIQMVLTTSNRVSLVDIRSDSINHNYVDRFRLASVSPTELFGQIVFSKRTDYQFYLLSNERLRVFDKRFLSQPMASMEHMLDPENQSTMRMKLISDHLGDVETLCISSLGRLCFLSFDQKIRVQELVPSSGELINPCSLHAPLHEPSLSELTGSLSNELCGLDVAMGNLSDNSNEAFSVFQVSQVGDIWVRTFEKISESFQVVKVKSQAKIVLERHKMRKPEPYRHHSDLVDDYPEKYDRRPSPDIPDDDFLNILDSSSIVCAEDKLTSKRALEKFEMMKKKLYKSKM